MCDHSTLAYLADYQCLRAGPEILIKETSKPCARHALLPIVPTMPSLAGSRLLPNGRPPLPRPKSRRLPATMSVGRLRQVRPAPRQPVGRDSALSRVTLARLPHLSPHHRQPLPLRNKTREYKLGGERGMMNCCRMEIIKAMRCVCRCTRGINSRVGVGRAPQGVQG